MQQTALHLYSSEFRFRLESSALQKNGTRQYQIHQTSFREKIHSCLERLWRPAALSLLYGARIIEPFSGRKKGNALTSLAKRIYALALALVWGAAALATAPVLLPLHLWFHRKRPAVQYICPEREVPLPQGPLHIRTHNIAQGPESFVALSDLRSNRERAAELVDSILKDPEAPRFLLFQEAYHQTETFAKLRVKYPYILHSVAPDALGLSSGFFVASQYPLEEIELHVLPMEWPDRIIGRGALKVRIRTPEGSRLDLFGVHLQALLGKRRADRRLEQLQHLHEWMGEEYKKEEIPQLLMGDLNTSSVTAWGENNEDPAQPEYKVLEYFRGHFADCFAEQHDPLTGVRVRGEPRFLAGDNRRMGVDLPEPTGSWYHGPFANPGIALKLKQLWDRVRHRYPAPHRLIPIKVPPDWGTARWHQTQEAYTARYDYIAIPNHCRERIQHIATEIRRIALGAHRPSAPSDHLPVDALFTLREAEGARP